MSRLGEILTDTDPPVHAIIMWNVNPLVSVPNAELIKRGMVRDDLLTIVHEQFMTDTAKYADYVFPATTQIESADITPSWGHLYLGWNEPRSIRSASRCQTQSSSVGSPRNGSYRAIAVR